MYVCMYVCSIYLFDRYAIDDIHRHPSSMHSWIWNLKHGKKWLPCCSWNIIRMFGFITNNVETCWTWYTVEHHHPLWFWESMIPLPVDWTNGMGRALFPQKNPHVCWNLYPLWWLVGECYLTFTFAVMFRFLFTIALTFTTSHYWIIYL